MSIIALESLICSIMSMVPITLGTVFDSRQLDISFPTVNEEWAIANADTDLHVAANYLDTAYG